MVKRASVKTATFFILVMDKYQDDVHQWIYSASARTAEKLQGLRCYNDPPHGLPKETFDSVSSVRTRLPPCAGGDTEEGTIYGITHL